MTHTGEGGEEGQIGLVLLALVAALLIGSVYIVQYGAKEEVGAKARTAADAAALAAATAEVDYVIATLAAGRVDFEPDLDCRSGRGSADTYAQRNGGAVRAFHCDRGTVRVTVSVPRGNSGRDGHERSAARVPRPACSRPESGPAAFCTVQGLGRIEIPAVLDPGLITKLRKALEPRLVAPA
jgi:hypothetical protein